MKLPLGSSPSSTTLRDPNAWRLENEPCLSRYKKQNAKIPGGRKVLEKKLPNTLTAHCVRFWGAPTMATEAWPRSVAPTPAFLQPKPLPPPRLHTGPPTGRHAPPLEPVEHRCFSQPCTTVRPSHAASPDGRGPRRTVRGVGRNAPSSTRGGWATPGRLCYVS